MNAKLIFEKFMPYLSGKNLKLAEYEDVLEEEKLIRNQYIACILCAHWLNIMEVI